MPSTKITAFDMAGGISAVKRVQRGTITIGAESTYGTATIDEVNIEKSVVLFSGDTFGSTGGSAHYPPYSHVMLRLTDSTTVIASRASSYGSTDDVTVPYQVIEFY